jgi:hypothetical protein
LRTPTGIDVLLHDEQFSLAIVERVFAVVQLAAATLIGPYCDFDLLSLTLNVDLLSRDLDLQLVHPPLHQTQLFASVGAGARLNRSFLQPRLTLRLDFLAGFLVSRVELARDPFLLGFELLGDMLLVLRDLGRRRRPLCLELAG